MQCIRIVGKESRVTKNVSLETQEVIDVSLQSLKSDVVDSIGAECLFKMMQDDMHLHLLKPSVNA